MCDKGPKKGQRQNVFCPAPIDRSADSYMADHGQSARLCCLRCFLVVVHPRSIDSMSPSDKAKRKRAVAPCTQCYSKKQKVVNIWRYSPGSTESGLNPGADKKCSATTNILAITAHVGDALRFVPTDGSNCRRGVMRYSLHRPKFLAQLLARIGQWSQFHRRTVLLTDLHYLK